MAGNESESDVGTDGSSIRPVSSLRSHFEALKKAGVAKVSAPTPKDHQTRFLQDNPQTLPTARASLDLPRPTSSWSSTSRHSSRPATPQTLGTASGQSRPTPTSGQQRPMSMDLRSTPHLHPTVRVESPRSPPRTTPGSRSGSRSPDRLLSTIAPGYSTQGAPISNPLVSPSPIRLPPIVGIRRHEDAENRASDLEGPQYPVRSSSIAPIVNRSEKPKIPAKPKVAPQQRGRLPHGATDEAVKDVSPFGTPSSSDESLSAGRQGSSKKAGGLEATRVPNSVFANGGLRDTTSGDQKSAPRDPRQFGFSGPRLGAEPRQPRSSPSDPHDGRTYSEELEDRLESTTYNSGRQVHTSVGHRDVREAGFEGSRELQRHEAITSRALPTPEAHSPTSGMDGVRRDIGQFKIPSSRASDSPIEKSTSTRRAPPPPPPQGLRVQGNVRAPPPPRPTQPFDRSTKLTPATHKIPASFSSSRPDFAPPPKRSTFEENSGQEAGQTLNLFSQDSDDAEEMESEFAPDLPMTRSEYPDSSLANRRPPLFKEGHAEISTRFDSRTFDICGRVACTTGYVTRAWDITTGDEIYARSHGETLKMLSIAFKPGETLEDEGSRVWVGSNVGDIQELDLKMQVMVGESKAHKPREVIRILRKKKDLWTFDEEGKLLIWPAEEAGVPSLSRCYQCPSKLPKGHTFSMVVHDKLWYATGREMRVFRPGSDASFSVLNKPLSQPGTGEIYSGTYSGHNGGCVYLGHLDGKVSIYSTGDYACIGVVKASDYKIVTMCFVGKYLWAAYKTGKIYVYDVSFTPWKVKKDWQAHNGPAASMTFDRNSLHQKGLLRLQVASLGHDNCIRFWDATLEDDWLEAAMQQNDAKYCTFREVRAVVITWNVGACSPRELQKDFVADAVNFDDPPELLIFGFQEIVDLEDRAVTAKTIFGFGKKKDKEKATSEQHVSRVYREWRDYLSVCINKYLDPQYRYTELHTSCLIGLFQCIFVLDRERRSVQNIDGTEVKCGMGGHYGNKGALITRFMFDDSSLCFINCHLAAGQTHTSHRNNDIATILEANALPAEREPNRRTSYFVGGGDGTQVLDHEICILNGDLNYRIDSIPRDKVISMVQKGELDKLLERDQIMVSRRKVSGFRLSPFSEAPITFAPTYKYDVGTDKYDTSEKKRSPAWCDRLLYRGLGRVKQLEYQRHEIRASDHRPVSGTFIIQIKKINPHRQDKVRTECHQQFGRVSKKLAEEASIEYLIDSIGMRDADARAAIKVS